jgi:predicted HTH domain antitoxin
MFAASDLLVVFSDGSYTRTQVMAEVVIKLPDALARVFGDTPEARSQRVAEDAAIEEYRAGRLSQRQVGEMLNLNYWETEHFLAGRDVPVNYGIDDLQADRATLNDILFGQ